MNPRSDQTKAEAPAFDFSAFPADTLFLDRRSLPGGRAAPDRTDAAAAAAPPSQPRARKERRRRVDPTTFEKQYNEEEMEFMNAIQTFKIRSGKMFPSHGDILKVALQLGYRQPVDDDDAGTADADLATEAAGVAISG